MHEWKAQILTPSLPAAETPFPQSTICGLQDDWSTDNQKKKKKKSLYLVHRLLCAMCCHQSEMNYCGFVGLIRNVLERYR